MIFPDLECEDFTRMNNHLTGDGDFIINHAERDREQCEATCLSLPPQRYCQAYVLTHSNNCSLIGYILFQNDTNVHYRRICRKGTNFIKIFSHSKHSHKTNDLKFAPCLKIFISHRPPYANSIRIDWHHQKQSETDATFEFFYNSTFSARIDIQWVATTECQCW